MDYDCNPCESHKTVASRWAEYTNQTFPRGHYIYIGSRGSRESVKRINNRRNFRTGRFFHTFAYNSRPGGRRIFFASVVRNCNNSLCTRYRTKKKSRIWNFIENNIKIEFVSKNSSFLKFSLVLILLEYPVLVFCIVFFSADYQNHFSWYLKKLQSKIGKMNKKKWKYKKNLNNFFQDQDP